MREVIFEKEVQYKLADLKARLIAIQGEEKGLKTLKSILTAINNLGTFASIGKNIKDTYNVECPDSWFLLYVNKNYFIFSKSETKITVLKMYDNKQDFIYDLFGMEMRSKESMDFWGE